MSIRLVDFSFMSVEIEQFPRSPRSLGTLVYKIVGDTSALQSSK